MHSPNNSSSRRKLPMNMRRAIAIRATERTALQKLLLLVLNSYSDKTGVSWPSIYQLELDCNLARSTVIKIMGELRSLGLVIRTRSGEGNRRNVYKLNVFRKDSTVRSGCPVNPGRESQGGDLNAVVNESGKRTRHSPARMQPSPADGLDTSDRQTCPSFKSSLKLSIEEESHTKPRSKRLHVLRRWLHVIENIDMPYQSVSTWFSTFKPVSLVKGVLTVESDSVFAIDWCNIHYSDQLTAMKVVTRLIQQTAEVTHGSLHSN